MTPMWKDGILLLLRLANASIEAGQKQIGLQLLATAVEAQRPEYR